MHPAKNTPAIAQVRSRERDAEVTQLKNQVAFLTEKVNHYENLEVRLTQLIQLVQKLASVCQNKIYNQVMVKSSCCYKINNW